MSPPPWPLVQSSSVLVFYCYCNKEPQTSGLNQHQCTILQFGEGVSEIWNGFHWVKNQCVCKAAFLRNDQFSCLLQLLMAPTSLACGLLPFQVNNSQSSVSHPASLWHWLSMSFLHLWESLWLIRPNQIIQQVSLFNASWLTTLILHAALFRLCY